MARQARFVLPGLPHLVSQRGHNGGAIVYDAADARQWVGLMREVVATHHMPLHGWSLGEAEFRLLVSPGSAHALARLVQDLGRRYVGAFNHRHGRSGTLWDGRFRCAAVLGDEFTLDALQHAESLELHLDSGGSGSGSAHAGPGGGSTGSVTLSSISSLGHHLGRVADALIVDPPAYWNLGNTPFERHAAWQSRLSIGLAPRSMAGLDAALRSGRPWAGRAALDELQRNTARPLRARPRGRPAAPKAGARG